VAEIDELRPSKWSCGEDWSVGKGGVADLERERIEGRGGG
jgi:hypothetical protein